jgi:hypothetical protein
MIELTGATEETPGLVLRDDRRARMVPGSTDHRGCYLDFYLVVLPNEKAAPCWRGRHCSDARGRIGDESGNDDDGIDRAGAAACP